jgi:hypothetical protein
MNKKIRELCELDRVEIRKACKVNYILPLLILFIAIIIVELIALTSYSLNSIVEQVGIIGGVAMIAGVILVVSNKKHWKDLKEGKKFVERKLVTNKEKMIDHEAGSGGRGYKMKAFEKFSIVVENRRYRVPKGLWIQLEEGEEVAMHTACNSQLLIHFDTIRRSHI